jgi:hypothetical protein
MSAVNADLKAPSSSSDMHHPYPEWQPGLPVRQYQTDWLQRLQGRPQHADGATYLSASGHGIKVNSADPGYTVTDLNGHRGTQTIPEGAAEAMRLALLAP